VTRTVKLGFKLSLRRGLDFVVNGERHHHDEPVKVGELQVWDVVNATMMDHPFHLHGFFFQVLEIDGKKPAWRSLEDVINVPPKATVRIAAPLMSAIARRRGIAMPYVIGIVLSVSVALFARCVGLDRDRAFYPTVLMVIASYYVLFAAMSQSVHTVVLESVVMAVFVIGAVAGFKSSAWIVVAALAGHGIFDALHGHVLQNSGVPAWWPAFCLAYDLGAAGSLAWLLQRRPGGLIL
jgi:hypothetical protein